jgi:hypothetical protein
MELDQRGTAARRAWHNRAITGAIAAALLAGTTQHAMASSVAVESDLTYDNYTFNEFYDKGDNAQTGTTEASTASNSYRTEYQGIGYELSGAASGGSGAVHLNTDEEYNAAYPDGSNFEYESQSTAVLTLSDVIINSLPTVTSVTTSINFLLEGSLQSSSTVYSGNGLVVSTYFGLAVIGNGKSAGAADYYLNESNGNPGLYSGSGFLSNFSGQGTVTSGQITLPTNTPFTLELDASLTSDIKFSNTAGSASSIGNFGDTLSFATTGPVFNLPDGDTASSISGNVVGNNYLGDIYAAVPEPATCGILGVAAIGLLARRRR